MIGSIEVSSCHSNWKGLGGKSVRFHFNPLVYRTNTHDSSGDRLLLFWLVWEDLCCEPIIPDHVWTSRPRRPPPPRQLLIQQDNQLRRLDSIVCSLSLFKDFLRWRTFILIVRLHLTILWCSFFTSQPKIKLNNNWTVSGKRTAFIYTTSTLTKDSNLRPSK